jgi:hypothetical protein
MLRRLRPPVGRRLLVRATAGSVSTAPSVISARQFEPPVRYIHHTIPRCSSDVSFEGVSDDVSKLINKHAQVPQTSVSLQALMRTGRGEFLHKHFDEVDQHTATELVLIQV